LYGNYAMEIRVWMDNHVPCSGYAAASFFASLEDA
jgi:hypothetical protein